ncbi:MAG: ABC-type transport auxiliary lipoprotein family protein, partial [Myxococcota bacterium]|nr:ABC-type transport auxiliary lipoprotein family protein [Myxococcota bacterium]
MFENRASLARMLGALALGVLVLLSSACRSSAPTIHYYQMLGQPIEISGAQRSDVVLGIDYLSANAAYEDTRIIYRKSPYRLDYYNFHRWSAPPSVMVTDAMRDAFHESGYFKGVRSGFANGVDLLLKGRLIALEEVDVSEDEWRARIVLDLQVVDTRSGDVIWSRVVKKEQAIEERTPEGVAIAASKGLKAIVAEIVPEIIKAPRPRASRGLSPTAPAPDQDGA